MPVSINASLSAGERSEKTWIDRIETQLSQYYMSTGFFQSKGLKGIAEYEALRHLRAIDF